MKYLTQKTKYKDSGNPNFKKGLPHCKLCDKELSDYHCKICKQCIIKNKEPIHFCKDCKIKISRNGIRCQSCHIKNLWKMRVFSSRKGVHNSNFRHGKTYNNHCIDCKKLLNNYRSKRCPSCAHKGKLSSLFGKITHGKGSYYKNIWMRSGYEVAYAKWLDKQDIKWCYESKTFDLGNTTYTPDFYLPETNTYIEIKGWWRDDAKKKFKLFKKQYPRIKIVVLNKAELTKKEII